MALVIIFFCALSGLLFYYSNDPGRNTILAITAIIITGAVTVSLIFYRIWTGPLIIRHKLAKKHAIIRSRNQFAGFMDDLPLGVFIKNSDSRATYLNKYMDRIFGKSNCLNKTPYNIFDRSTADRVAGEDKRVLAGENVMVEEVLTDKNGKERVYMTHKFLVYDDFNEPMVGGISIEITRRKEAEYKLRILSKAIRNSPVCVIITDPEGCIEFVNPAFVNSTGYSFAEVMGKNMSIINSGHHDKQYFREMWNRMKLGGDWQGEILNKKKDGTLFWELVNISSVRNREGQITHFVAIKDDISKRKQVEDALLKAKEKAEESDKLKSAFLANMSHEIRTPMNAIVGLSNLLGNQEMALPERETFSQIISENSNVLLQLIDDIIDVSKIEAGQITLRPSNCNINSILAEINESFKMQALNKAGKVNLQLKVPGGENSLSTFTDPQRLRQIITNLVSNALKFTEEGAVTFGFRPDGNGYILFFVEDTGIGIPDDKKEYIFDRFSQVNEMETRQYRGAGLGLSISRSLVELLGGSIWVESGIESGSKFYFTIPHHPVNNTENETTNGQYEISYPVLDGKVIVVAEDLEVNYRLIKAMLNKTGAVVEWTRTGRETLKTVYENPSVELVLLDLNMPDINGYDTLVQLKEKRKDLPVIIQTAYVMNNEKESCFEAGCDGYITKPLQIEQLLSVIQHCMLQKN